MKKTLKFFCLFFLFFACVTFGMKPTSPDPCLSGFLASKRGVVKEAARTFYVKPSDVSQREEEQLKREKKQLKKALSYEVVKLVVKDSSVDGSYEKDSTVSPEDADSDVCIPVFFMFLDRESSSPKSPNGTKDGSSRVRQRGQSCCFDDSSSQYSGSLASEFGRILLAAQYSQVAEQDEQDKKATKRGRFEQD